MLLSINGLDVSSLLASVSTSGSTKECARTLKAELLQSPTDHNIPTVQVALGDQVQFEEDGQSFFGTVREISRSTASDTISVTAKDFGVYIVNNQISAKLKDVTPAQAAASLAGQYGIPVGSLVDAGYTFSRKWVGVSLYDAIMTGYALAAAESGKVYRLWFDGTAMVIGEMGDQIAAVLSEDENLMQAAYSESIERMISQVDIVDQDGNITDSVQGDMTYGVTRQQINAGEDAQQKAQEILASKGLTRKGTVKNLGNAACISGRAILVQESVTGLYGLFYISADTHSWKKGLYTNSLTLSWENTMDAKAAGAALEESTKKSSSKSKGSIEWWTEVNEKYGDK